MQSNFSSTQTLSTLGHFKYTVFELELTWSWYLNWRMILRILNKKYFLIDHFRDLDQVNNNTDLNTVNLKWPTVSEKNRHPW